MQTQSPCFRTFGERAICIGLFAALLKPVLLLLVGVNSLISVLLYFVRGTNDRFTLLWFKTFLCHPCQLLKQNHCVLEG